MRTWHEERNAPKPGKELCNVADIEPGAIKEFSFSTESKYPFHLFVFNDAGTLRCYMNRCPHFGIKLNLLPDQFFTYDRSQFMCCHHLARFNITDGLCTDGPPEGLNLEIIPITVNDGIITISEN